MNFKTTFIKLTFAVIIPLGFISLLMGSLATAATPTIVPLGAAQSGLRAAYQAIFRQIQQGERVHWAQQSFTLEEQSYLAGTFIVPNGSLTGQFDRLIVTTTLPITPSLALHGQGTRLALFRSQLVGVNWEEAQIRQLLDSYLWGALPYDLLDENDLATKDLSGYRLIILPTVHGDFVQSVADNLTEAALSNLREFVWQGGMLYAQGNGAYLAEKAEIISLGTVDLATPLVLTASTQANAAELAILQPDSPLTFSWLTQTLYSLSDPLYRPDDSFVTVAEFTNLDGANQPAILTRAYGQGQVILVDGHPTAPTKVEQLPIFMNAIFWALGQPAELYGAAHQIYNPTDFEPDLIPAYEPDVPIQIDLTFSNSSAEPLTVVTVTELITLGFKVDTVSPEAEVTALADGSTQVTWHLGEVAPGKVRLSLLVKTTDQALKQGYITLSTGQAQFTQAGRVIELTHPPFKLSSRMPARLQLDRDIEGDRQYYIPPRGLFLDVAIPIENKEDSLATDVVITDVVLLLSPIVDMNDQETILSQNDGETIYIANEPFFFDDEPGAMFQLPDGYTRSLTSTTTITLKDWTGDYAAFDVPYGTHFCGYQQPRGTGNCITIPITYAKYITVTADNKLLLPVKILTWHLGDWPGYHYEDPALRYGIHSYELLGRRVTFAGDPGIAPTDVVIQGTEGSVYTHLGDHPVFYRNHVASGLVYVPHAPVTPTVQYTDIWSRTHVSPTLRAAFYDIFNWAACPCVSSSEQHAAINVTFEMRADVNQDGQSERVLTYPSHFNGPVQLDILIKDYNLTSQIMSDEMVIDLGIFKGLGIAIKPISDSWANSWSSTAKDTQLVEVIDSSAYHHLLFQHRLTPQQNVELTIHAVINGYSGLEGLFKLLDGARLVYRQPLAGPSRYELFSTHVRGVLGEGARVTFNQRLTPINLSRYGDMAYIIYSFDDPDDPRLFQRNGFGDPFLQSFGFGKFAATTYIGGREEKKILHSIVSKGDKTRLRVEIDNNGNTPLSNVAITPQPPTGISFSRTYTDPMPDSVFADLPFLYLETIPVAGHAVYYFDLVVSPDYTGPLGQVVNIPIAVSGTGFPSEFKIPAAQLGIVNEQGQAYQNYGFAQTVTFSDTLPSYLTPTHLAFVSLNIVQQLAGAADPAIRDQIFNTLTNTLPYQADFTLPAAELAKLYTPQQDKLYLVMQATISPSHSGPIEISPGANMGYQDSWNIWRYQRAAPLQAEAHGALLQLDYACTGVNIESTCVLTSNESQTVHLQATVRNQGDDLANSVQVSLELPSGVRVSSSQPQGQLNGQTITWNIGDLAPGGLVTMHFNVDLTLNESGNIVARAQQLTIPLIKQSYGQFTDNFSKKTVKANLAGLFELPVEIKAVTPTPTATSPRPPLPTDVIPVPTALPNQTATATPPVTVIPTTLPETATSTPTPTPTETPTTGPTPTAPTPTSTFTLTPSPTSSPTTTSVVTATPTTTVPTATVVPTSTLPIPTRVPPVHIYLPLILRDGSNSNPVPLPDLHLSRFTITPSEPTLGRSAQIELVVENSGGQASGDFWVDLYINPNGSPKINQTWSMLCQLEPCDGLAWQVHGLQPHEAITLTSTIDSYQPLYSRWGGGFRVSGPLQLYIYVDSWNGTNSNGAVLEANEENNLEMKTIDVAVK